MRSIRKAVASLTVLVAALFAGCSSDGDSREREGSDGHAESRGEQDRDGGEHGEESGTELALNEHYDKVRNGTRLMLAYDADINCFVGTVENVTKKLLERVRVEVHLSNGKELGPTTPTYLPPGAKADIRLTASSGDFDGWSAHAEVGGEMHSHREGHGKHD